MAYERQRYLLRVDLPRPLAPGATSTVAFDFRTAAPQNASADFYGAFNKENGVLGLASSYPIAAIVRGGAWDIGQPDCELCDFVNSETALYDVTLTAPADWSLATTGVVVDGRLDGGQQTARIVSGPQRDFMIAANQLRSASANVDGTTINSYYRAEHEQGGQLALQAASEALRIFNARYGRYPLAELDIVETAARTFLGVEYPGLIMLEQGLYEEGNGLAITTAHEVAHQWWYSQVGNNVQTEAWIDEALASYSQIVYQESVNGPEAAERELEGFRERYRQALADGRDAPVDQPNTAFRGNYVSMVYGKAVLFFQAMRKQIGEEAFDRFLHAHYSQHRYGYITGADLLADAESACGCELDTLYADWITKAVPVEVP
jgi:aminopeptidase N